MTIDRGTQILHLVLEYWRAGGWLMLPLALVSFGIWYGYLSMLRQLREAVTTSGQCLEELECRFIGKDPNLSSWLDSLPGATPRVLRHLLARLAAGLPFRDAFAQCRDAELAVFTHSFYLLGALVTVAPLTGLLGTVLGMVATFHGVALQSGETAAMVSGGISQALITTQVGLLAALPGAFGLAHLFQLYQRLRNQLDRCESYLYLMMAHRDQRGAG